MKKIFLVHHLSSLFSFLILSASEGFCQNIGLGTINPLARLHVVDSTVLFSAVGDVSNVNSNPPLQGSGRRMMWYANRAAFRVGYVDNQNWDRDSIGNYSFACGHSSMANGISSVAMGNSTSASGAISTAFGHSTTASGTRSTAMGHSTTASGDHSTALGWNSTASGGGSLTCGYGTQATHSWATAMGTSSIASGYCSFAIGNLTRASGDYSTAMGNGSTASGVYALSMGYFSSASGYTSTATGYSTTAGGSYSMTMGVGTISPSYACVSLGKYNYSAPTSGTSWVTTDPVLIVGNGTTDIFRSNILEFYKNGNLIIWGTLTQLSDARLKTNISPLRNSLQKLTRLNGYSYLWNNNTVDQSIQTGLLAQEVKEIIPELVGNNLKGDFTLNYNGLIPYLIEAIKELKELVSEMRKEIDELKKEKK